MIAAAVGGWSESCSRCQGMARARVCEDANDVAALGSYTYGGELVQVQVED